MISISCGACGKSYTVGAEKAGRQAKCACGAIVNVPGAISQPAPGSPIPAGPSIVAGDSSVVKAEINASQNIGHLAGDLVQNKTVTSNTTNQQTFIIHNYHFHGPSSLNSAEPGNPTKNSVPRCLEIKIDENVGMELVLVPAGTFRMGSSETEFERSPCLQLEDRHRVKISKPFYLGKYQVTQSLWQAVMGENPSHFKGANLPVENVSWDDAMLFCKELRLLTGHSFRLPTEAQWEYACRAGATSAYCFGDDQSGLGAYAWFGNNSGDRLLDASHISKSTNLNIEEAYWAQVASNNCRTHPVGEKLPNAWGLHDMHGNVWEWCSDVLGSYSSHCLTDPEILSPPSDRICRGGAWSTAAHECRSAKRGWLNPQLRHCNYGLRILLPIEGSL
jgi:formylglycine-generating enzyme required for sulfatase activity